LIGPKWRLLYDFLLSRNITLENRLGSGDTDIFLIHWVRPRDVPARSLRRIDVPAVVVLHDARFILGISHYPESAKEPLRLGSLTWRERIASALVRASLNPNRTTLICPSLWMRDVAIQAGWPEETISYVPYPIDLNFWRPIPEFVSQKENNQFRIGFGFAGEHAAFRKGADIFSGALEMLSKGPIVGGPELEFLYFGDAIPPQFPKSLPRSISLQTLGHLDDSELRLLFTQLDLVIIPSRQESMGQIALEAQACGTAVVVSQDTGLASALVPGGGWTFANGSASDLAAVINLALSDRSELKLRGLTARQGIHHLFSEEVVVEKYISHLRAVGRLTNR
jgi:glycosyltransferase involved in cell wall biosynthesis